VFELIEPDEAEIFVVPVLSAVARPVVPTAAAEGAEEVHVADEERFRVVLSVKVPVAVNCWVVPRGIDALVGVTEIETNAAAETVRLVWPDMLPEATAIVTVPIACEVAKPVPLTVAMLVPVEDQVAVDVRFCVLPSEYVPVAVSCSVLPKGIEPFTGVTAMESRAFALTVSAVLLLIAPEVAVIVVDPTATVLASPAVLIVATAVLDDVQVTLLVMFFVLPSE
jgi:hypothetical protein